MEILNLILLIVVAAGIFIAPAVIFRKNAGRNFATLEAQIDEVKRERDALREEKLRLVEQKAVAETRAKRAEILIEENKKLTADLSESRANLFSEKEKSAKFETAQKELLDKMKLEFNEISNKMFEQHSEKFKNSSKNEIDALIKPFAENLSALKKQIEESFKGESETTATLRGEIKTLVEQSGAISDEARNLTNALRGNAKIQGDWGETLLETTLQSAGLIAGTHYLTQSPIEVDGQTRGRTDFEILLPNNRRIIVDSKVSLNAYVDYCAANDETARENAKKAHLASVKKHIDELAGKYKKEDSLEFSMMFVPNESAYLLACDADKSLWDYAFKKHVALVSGTHLLAVVKLVEQLWSQDSRIKNVQKIAEIGEKMLKKFADAMKDFDDVETRLESTKKAVESFKTKMNGRGSAIKLANDMKNLGVKAPNNLPKFEDVPEIDV